MLGFIASYIGRTDEVGRAHHIPIVANAFFVSLLAVDGLLRFHDYREALPLTFGTIAIIGGLALNRFTRWWAICLVAVPLCVIAAVVIDATGYLGRL